MENVSEVTTSHVKLSKPVFSPRAVLMKVGFPVKINCNVLIYKTNTAFLTLHVYLVPRDPGLQQVISYFIVNNTSSEQIVQGCHTDTRKGEQKLCHAPMPV